ncbi:hypothetical protein BC941DRAFT_467265 [Chlamydoabsidia padenii]|nr:hypothetical protein BC941DRAFT_467265 [Chlamydoabsidia padenii]
MSATPKVECPICGQEFPVYDQRGFRNAGFTAHHNRCMERQYEQQSESHQQNQQSSRASRFALAIRRQILPAHPISSNSNMEDPNRGQNPSSSALIFPLYDGPARSNSLVSANHTTASQTNSQHLLIEQQQRRPITRQRHTWNHWNIRRNLRRRATNSTSSALSSATSTLLPTSTQHIRVRRSLPAINTSTEHSVLPLFRTMTDTITFDNNNTTEASITHSSVVSYFSAEPMYSPTTLTGNSPPSYFTSMLTSLPLEYVSSPPTDILPINSNNDSNYNGARNMHSSLQQQQSMISASSPGWAMDYNSPTDNNEPIQEYDYLQEHGQHSHSLLQDQPQPLQSGCQHYYQSFNHLSQTPNNTFGFQQSNDTLSDVDLLPPYINNQHPLVSSCAYCRSRNGVHQPSCNLLQFFLSNLGGDSSPPT